MTTDNTYRVALVVAFGAALFLVWAIGALGVIGVEGDPADHMYLGVIGVLMGGAVGTRLQPQGMARASIATAGAQALVAVVALLMGEHQAPETSVIEILGLNAMFVALFLGSARLFAKSVHAPRSQGDPRGAAGPDDGIGG